MPSPQQPVERWTIYKCPKHGERSGPRCYQVVHRQPETFCKIECEQVEVVPALQAERLAALLRRLHEWDSMQSQADGAYWRAEIESALRCFSGEGEG